MSAASLPDRLQLESVTDAEDYLKKHRIQELFHDLCGAVCFNKPENVNKFLVGELEKRRDAGPGKVMFFDEQEVEAVFRLADLKQKGSVSRVQAQQAMASIANTQVLGCNSSSNFFYY